MMSTVTRRLLVVGLLALLIAGAIGAAALATDNDHGLTVEVAEDPSRFVFAGNHLIEEGELAGFPDYGDYFVTQGYIYPEGTLGVDDAGVTCEFDADGIPTSCEPLYEPIGEWTCYGVHIGEGAATTEGAWVVTTQIFDITSHDYRTGTVVTEGFESPEVGKTVARAITGGTGQYSVVHGEQLQTYLGLDPEQLNVRMTNTFSLHG